MALGKIQIYVLINLALKPFESPEKQSLWNKFRIGRFRCLIWWTLMDISVRTWMSSGFSGKFQNMSMTTTSFSESLLFKDTILVIDISVRTWVFSSNHHVRQISHPVIQMTTTSFSESEKRYFWKKIQALLLEREFARQNVHF